VRATALAGRSVARVHTGDPSLYGALREQAALLDADGIPWRVVPGVTAACAAAAAAGITFTVPEVTQSLIISRLEGRTPVPAREHLHLLAQHGASMAVYLSAASAQALQDELSRSLPPETHIFCAHMVSWPEEQLHWTTLGELAQCITSHNLTRQTVFLVLPAESCEGAPSRLYAADFSHGYRAAKS
jgi:Precorrin-4 methylase